LIENKRQYQLYQPVIPTLPIVNKEIRMREERKNKEMGMRKRKEE